MKNKHYFGMVKWFFVGCLISFGTFHVMVWLKMDMKTIITSFQTSTGILLGGMFLQREMRLKSEKQ